MEHMEINGILDIFYLTSTYNSSRIYPATHGGMIWKVIEVLYYKRRLF